MRWIEGCKMRKELMKMLLLSREDLPISLAMTAAQMTFAS
jgi:hypothetical protein